MQWSISSIQTSTPSSPSWSVKAIKVKMLVKLCCILCSLPDPNSGAVLPNDNNRFQSHHLLCYWCSHINTGTVALCHTLSLPYASVLSECVTPHLLFDALWPLSPRPFWKNTAWDTNTHPNTAHHLVHVSLRLFLPKQQDDLRMGMFVRAEQSRSQQILPRLLWRLLCIIMVHRG